MKRPREVVLAGRRYRFAGEVLEVAHDLESGRRWTRPTSVPSDVATLSGLSILANDPLEEIPDSTESLDDLRLEALAWQARTFTARTPASIATHLEREAKELRADPLDDEELADVALLVFALSEGRDLAGAIRRKLEKNYRRTWGKPDADGVVEHTAEGSL